MKKMERNIILYLENHIGIIVLLVITFLSLYIRYLMLPFMSSDYLYYNLEWFRELQEYGGIKGIAEYGGDYNYAYIFWLSLLTYLPIPGALSIKLFHIVFDYVGAIMAGLIAKKIYSGSNNAFVVAYSLVIVSPLVLLNSAYWGQSDFIYASFVLLALYLLLNEKYALCFTFFGVAFSFKLQAVFILPLFILVYVLNKKFSILNFLFIPLGFLISCFPGMICSGKGIKGLLNIYFGQIQQENYLVQNFPNIYYWISSDHYDLYLKLGICLLTIIFMISGFYLVNKKAYLTDSQIIALGMWCILCVVYFCPKMHERYGFVAEILSIIWVIGHKKWIWYPIVMSTTVLFSYFAVLYGYYLYAFQNMAIVNVLTFIAFSIYLFSDIKSENMLHKNSFPTQKDD